MHKIKPLRLPLVLLAFLSYGTSSNAALNSPAQVDRAALVNPFIGTDSGGNTYPGACAPFGMVQFSPNWDNNGYYYPESKMHGFVVNLLSGDGGANLGQVLMTATTGPVKVDRGSTDYSYDHQHESASAGSYQVLMKPWNINAELTALSHTGMAKFTFPAGTQRNIIVPISYANNPVTASQLHVVDSQTVEGEVTSNAFYGPGHITVYFVMCFSKPCTRNGTWTGTAMSDGGKDVSQTGVSAPPIGFYGSYPPSASPSEIDVRIGISYVDIQGALANLNSEIPAKSTFSSIKALAQTAWNKELSVIDVEGGSLVHDRVFYTALYHVLVSPTIGDDVDGRYRGYDNAIHVVDHGHAHFYQTFSGWDIYRTEIPLLTIVEPNRTQDMAQSIVDMANQLGYIDRWPEINQATYTMNGNPLTICLTHIWNAGERNFDIESAYQAMWKQSQFGDPHDNIDVYQGGTEEQGGVTLNADCSVSTALEYDLSFSALGHLAQTLGKSDDANYLFGRALQYRDMYNPSSGFLQSRKPDGTWDTSFGGYTEGNQWIYLWFVPEDIQGLIDLMGGGPTFAKRLDQFFAESRYDPTNEPDLQAPFLYDFINRPWKTQHIVAETADKCFSDSPGGLAGGGNDDLGTMSAWYVLSQLGLYFVDPGVPSVEVCTPRFPKAVLHVADPLSNKMQVFEIDAPDASQSNEYIQSATLNGVALNRPWFLESVLLGGGKWTVTTGPQPNQSWGSSPFDRPYSLSCGWMHTPDNGTFTTIVPDGRTEASTWQYTTTKPSDNWCTSAFDDSGWKSGDGGFGTDDVGVTARTVWNTDDIWMRRSFALPAGLHGPAVDVYHDQDVDIYVNGLLVAQVQNWTHSYDPFELPKSIVDTLKPTGNILAVHVHHPGDGRHYADAGILDVTWPDDEK